MSLLTTPPTETTPPANTPPPAAGNTTPPPAAGATASWRDSLPEEIRGAAPLSLINDIPTLAKSYLNAQEMVGKKGIIPPTDKSTDEEWNTFYKQVGLPESLDKYELQKGKAGTSDEVLKMFKETAHKAGILPKQAQKLFDWFTGSEAQAAELQKQKTIEATAQGIEGLKKEWGTDYDKQVIRAQQAVKQVGGEEFTKYLTEKGLGNDPAVIKMMAKVGSLLAEDGLRGANGGKLGETTREEAQRQIDNIFADPKHPAFDRSHRGHENAAKQLAELYQKLSPQSA